MPSGYVKLSHWFCGSKLPGRGSNVLPGIYFGKSKVEKQSFLFIGKVFLGKLFWWFTA